MSDDGSKEDRSVVSKSTVKQSNHSQIDKVPYVKGEVKNKNYLTLLTKPQKTIICWNCQSILMVKDEWNIIQCTNCQKINRIPGTEQKEQIKINDNSNHFDLYLPYVVSQ